MGILPFWRAYLVGVYRLADGSGRLVAISTVHIAAVLIACSMMAVLKSFACKSLAVKDARIHVSSKEDVEWASSFWRRLSLYCVTGQYKQTRIRCCYASFLEGPISMDATALL